MTLGLGMRLICGVHLPEPRDAGPGVGRRSIRWWPAAAVAVLGAGAVLGVRLWPGLSRQQVNLTTLGILVTAGLLLLLWAVLLSRMNRRLRWAILGGAAAGGLLAVGLFELHGVTGDLVPIFRFRWSGTLAGVERSPTAVLPAAGARVAEARVDFPQFLGPHRNAMLPEGAELARDWRKAPPELLWRRLVGAAWSGFAIVRDRAITQEQQGETEQVVCYELPTGRVLWTHGDLVHYRTTIAGEGPRCTPTIHGDRVLTLGATGLLNCLELETGTRIWSKDIIADNGSRLGEWGAAGSPLVLEDLVIVNPGGKDGRSLVAYRIDTGAFVWGGGEDDASYSSPCVATIGGVRQVLIFNQPAVSGHDAATGGLLWRHTWDRSQPHVALPLVLPEDRVLVSSGYGVGSQLLQIRRNADGQFAVERLWKSIRLKSKFNNLVVRDGFVYGLDDGFLTCLEASTGALRWKGDRFGHGQFLFVRDLLLVTSERGEVVMMDPSPVEQRELTRFSALRGKMWNPPALAGDLLLVRTDEEAACYRLPVVVNFHRGRAEGPK